MKQLTLIRKKLIIQFYWSRDKTWWIVNNKGCNFMLWALTFDEEQNPFDSDGQPLEGRCCALRIFFLKLQIAIGIMRKSRQFTKTP